jgi:hypothetical protein
MIFSIFREENEHLTEALLMIAVLLEGIMAVY